MKGNILPKLRGLLGLLGASDYIQLITLLLIIWSYFFPTFEDFLDYFRGPEMRYVVVTSGTSLDAYQIKFNTQALMGQPEEKSPLAMVGLVVANQGNRQLKEPLQVSIEDLSTPIGELVIENHTIPGYMLSQCKGDDIFSPEDQVGEQSFCLRIDSFPPNSVVSVFVISSQSTTPLFRYDKLFIGTKEDPTAARRVQINRLFAENRHKSPYILFLFLVIITLILWNVIERLRRKDSDTQAS